MKTLRALGEHDVADASNSKMNNIVPKEIKNYLRAMEGYNNVSIDEKKWENVL